MPEVFEGRGEEATVQRIVVDHQDVAHVSPGLLRSAGV
jgi:hypothetical protein